MQKRETTRNYQKNMPNRKPWNRVCAQDEKTGIILPRENSHRQFNNVLFGAEMKWGVACVIWKWNEIRHAGKKWVLWERWDAMNYMM